MLLIAFLLGTATGALIATPIAWLYGADSMRARVDRKWVDSAEERHAETKYQLGLAGLSLTSHLTETVNARDPH